MKTKTALTARQRVGLTGNKRFGSATGGTGGWYFPAVIGDIAGGTGFRLSEEGIANSPVVGTDLVVHPEASVYLILRYYVG